MSDCLPASHNRLTVTTNMSNFSSLFFYLEQFCFIQLCYMSCYRSAIWAVTDQFQRSYHMGLLILLPRLKIQLLFRICCVSGIRKKVKEEAEPQLYLKLLFQEDMFYLLWSNWSKLVKWSWPSVVRASKNLPTEGTASHRVLGDG